MFSYGISGSGKTFTLFGPDGLDDPEAWFKWREPRKLWGIFPRLAYSLFEMCEKTWGFSMKYFQNVVDKIRDLMSPTAEERSYKGMKKDDDGFMDISWCIAAVLKSWDRFSDTFTKAHRRKAVAPTQFNRISTRGHCILNLVFEKPRDDGFGNEVDGFGNVKRQKGRIYVCDLAGAEPAGDIFYAAYSKVEHSDGTSEYKLMGPHKDQKLTKNLQLQSKKINLSLSEMSQYFTKLAQMVKTNRLKAGKKMPGCNSYFLCKYLKGVIRQGHTYMFCAIRPEATYLNYTSSSLSFATRVFDAQKKKKVSKFCASECDVLGVKGLAE